MLYATANTIERDGYVFVDGEYFIQNFYEQTKEWFNGEIDIDFNHLIDTSSNKRLFYYDCEDPEQRPGEDEGTFQARVGAKKRIHNAIKFASFCHLRLGRLKGEGRRKRRQKGVDVFLAVDAMEQAARGHMKRATIITGDGDFEPLVQSLVDLGIYVTVRAAKNTCSDTLISSADCFHELDFGTFTQFATTELSEKYPIPHIDSVGVVPRDKPVLRRGICGEWEMYHVNEDDRYCSIFLQRENEVQRVYGRIGIPVDRLELLIKIRYGSLSWHTTDATAVTV